MAVRSLNLLASSFLMILLLASPGSSCFGPKLFFAAGSELREQALFALVTLYVQEKTGVESTRVERVEGQDPLALIANEQVDLVFVPSKVVPRGTVFYVDGGPALVSGPRPLEELQFTTVLPAIKKLNHLLTAADVQRLADQIKAGQSAMSVARKYLMENRWI